ncbi:hypothetical protein [Rubrimonas sp.]|uniref:hypothetical protein n=1 Tax=Rubrimonas sp. TaxID=2036015 RepID=UPI002FDEA787
MAQAETAATGAGRSGAKGVPGGFFSGFLVGATLSAAALAALSLGAEDRDRVPSEARPVETGPPGAASAAPDAEAALMAPVAPAPAPTAEVVAPTSTVEVASPAPEVEDVARAPRIAPEAIPTPAPAQQDPDLAETAPTEVPPTVADNAAPQAQTAPERPTALPHAPEPALAAPPETPPAPPAMTSVAPAMAASSAPLPPLAPAPPSEAEPAPEPAPSAAAPPAASHAAVFAPSTPDAALLALVLTAVESTEIDLDGLKAVGAPITLAFPLRAEERARAARGAGFEVLARMRAGDAADAADAPERFASFPAAGLALSGELGVEAARALSAQGFALLSETGDGLGPRAIQASVEAGATAMLEVLRAAERAAAAGGAAAAILPASAAAELALRRWAALPRLAEPAPFSAVAARADPGTRP